MRKNTDPPFHPAELDRLNDHPPRNSEIGSGDHLSQMLGDLFQIGLARLEHPDPVSGLHPAVDQLLREVEPVSVAAAQAGPGVEEFPNSRLEKLGVLWQGVGNRFEAREPPIEDLCGHGRPQEVPLPLGRLEEQLFHGPRV